MSGLEIMRLTRQRYTIMAEAGSRSPVRPLPRANYEQTRKIAVDQVHVNRLLTNCQMTVYHGNPACHPDWDRYVPFASNGSRAIPNSRTLPPNTPAAGRL